MNLLLPNKIIKREDNSSINLTDNENEIYGCVKSRSFNRNSNEVDYLLDENNSNLNHEKNNQQELDFHTRIKINLLDNLNNQEKLIEEEIINTMQDVIGANTLYSQIIYAEFVIMFFSILSLITSLINYEINFSTSHLIEIKFDDYYSLINITTYLFNTLCCGFIMINIYFRYKFQMKFEAYTHNLSHQDTLISSGYFRNIIYEWILILIHPNIFLRSQTFRYKKIYAIKISSEYLTFTYNEVLLSLMMFRVYFIIKFFLTLTHYQTSRAARTCRLYGETNSYLFAVRCLFNKHPFYFVVVMFSCCLAFFTVIIRMYERVFNSPDRNSEYLSSKEAGNILDMDHFFNVLWTVIITLLTVGYGDYFAKTSFGRIYTCIGILAGLLTTSLVTVGFFKNLELSSVENKIFILLERMKLRHKYEDLSKEMVKILMLHHFTKFKARKIKEKLENNYEDMSDSEKNQSKEDIAYWGRKKDDIEIDFKHLVRDKNIANKNLDNTNSSSYVMDSIIDDITGIICDVDESYLSIDNIVKNFSNNFKNDENVIKNIKQLIKDNSMRKLNAKSKEVPIILNNLFNLTKSNLDAVYRQKQLEKEIEEMSLSNNNRNLNEDESFEEEC